MVIGFARRALCAAVCVVGCAVPSSAQPAGSCVPQWDQTIGTPGLAGTVLALATFDDGTGPALYAGGLFLQAGGSPASRIARWDGVSWSPLGSGLNGTVRTLVVFDDGTGPALYAAGDFTVAGGLPANRIARWDGTSWSAVGSGVNSSIWDMIVFDDGTGSSLYVGGFFTSAGGSVANRVARWDGSSWTSLGTGTNDVVFDFAVFDDGSGPGLYAGGRFTGAGGTTANRVARWDGTGWSALGTGADNTVQSLYTFDDGSGPALYVGGDFSSAGGVAANRIARWNGSFWSPLGSGIAGEVVLAMGSYDDGSGPGLYAGGDFSAAGGQPATRVARWDGVSWSPLGTGVTNDVEAFEVFNDGSGSALHIGGFFFSAGGNPSSQIAKWQGCPPAPVILSQPSNVLLPPLGGVAQFSVLAEGEQLTYQWIRDGEVLLDGLNISGATTAQLSVTSQGPSMTGIYFCLVTNAGTRTVATQQVVLAARPGCPGDVNFNGTVDLADLNLLLSRFGSICP